MQKAEKRTFLLFSGDFTVVSGYMGAKGASRAGKSIMWTGWALARDIFAPQVHAISVFGTFPKYLPYMNEFSLLKKLSLFSGSRPN